MKTIGDTTIAPVHRARCHCGSVELEIDLPDGITDLRFCNCSMCRRKGAVMASVPLAGLRVVKGQEALKLYQFHTRTAEHYFCRHCGIYTHHRKRSDPSVYGFNLGCLDGVNPFALKLDELPVNDGVNHLCDRK